MMGINGLLMRSISIRITSLHEVAARKTRQAAPLHVVVGGVAGAVRARGGGGGGVAGAGGVAVGDGACSGVAVFKGEGMTGNTRAAALGLLKAADEKVQDISPVLTVMAVKKLQEAQEATLLALRGVVEYVDAIEL